jgi:hypothetical protein
MLNLEQTLAFELPQARFLVLELAAVLDRLDEAAARSPDAKAAADDPRLQSLRAALEVLNAKAASADRVQRILHGFSDLSTHPTASAHR